MSPSPESLELLPSNAVIDVPAIVACCPYCDAALRVSANSWTEQRGIWIADGIDVHCTNEPDIDSDEWGAWFGCHSYMPYVYQLPVDNRIMVWLEYRFHFDL